MPIVDDVLRGLQIQIDTLWYNLLYSLAGMGWSLQRAFLMMGYTIELINQWLVEHAFSPLIAQTSASMQLVVSLSFGVALLVLGITYLLAAFARLRVVEWKSALAWYVAGALFFAFGPQLYQGLVDVRRALTQAFYGSALSGLQGVTGTAFTSLSSVSSADLGLIALCDNFGSYMPVWAPTVDGLDVALAYLRADGIDLMGYPSTPRDPACQPHPADPVTGRWTAGAVPWEWRRPGSYFANDRDPVFFATMTDGERSASLSMASTAQGRLLTAWPLIVFGVTEQLVYLLLTIAQGLTFVSFAVAIVFAFFRKTEVIARAIIDLWIELIIQTVVIALIQALVVTFFLRGTSSGNGIVVLGIGLICLIFMLIVLWSGIRAVWNALNRLFSAFGQATGGAVITPGSAGAIAAAGAVGVGAGAVGLAAGMAGGALSIGSNALAGSAALQQGATLAQTSGLMLGGVQPLAGAARTLTYLPGVRGTALGEAAEQFTEGALTRRIARDVPLVGRMSGPVLGAALLTDRDPDKAEYDGQGRVRARPMLVPAIGESLEAWTLPRRALRRMGMFTPDGAGDDAGGIGQRVAGSLRVTGAADVSSVLGDIMRVLGQRGAEVDYLAVAAALAQAVGVRPADDGRPAVRGDLARFGMFIEGAAGLGLTPEQTERVGREVMESADRQLSAATRSELMSGAVAAGRTREQAEREIGRLELSARLLPGTLVAIGTLAAPAVTVPAAGEGNAGVRGAEAGDAGAALAGSGAVLGGAE